VLLQLVDQHWREHLYAMDYLREGIHLRSLGQKDPLSEYRLEGHSMFQEMMEIIQGEFVRYMFHLEVQQQAPEPEPAPVAAVNYSYADDPIQGFNGDDPIVEMDGEPDNGHVVVEQRVVGDLERVGRNDPCPCGSGKKYKRCHGA
jgi:preprotein translocase subunit SecA